jgi:hypothetical protein
MYFLPTTAEKLTCERWDLVRDYLAGDSKATEWANAWPQELLVKWGTASEEMAGSQEPTVT